MSIARDVKVECWRRQRWAVILAIRCHKAHGTWTNRKFETYAWRPIISGFLRHCLASHFSWPLNAQLLSWELRKTKVQAKTARKLGWLQEHITKKLEPLFCFEHLRLILNHNCKNVLRAGESNYEIRFTKFKKIYILKDILLLAVCKFCFLHSTQPIKIAAWKSSHHIGRSYIRK